MTEKAYKKGSVFPPLEAGKLRLYSMRLCPYAQRTRIILAHKKIPYETVNIDLADKPEWFLEKNPLGLVPTLEQDGKVVYDSSICNEYIDAVYPQNRVTPTDPYRRARDKMLMEYNGKFTTSYYKSVRSTTEEDRKAALDAAFKAAETLEKELVERGDYFGGETVGMIDFLMYPHYERIDAVRTGFNIDILPQDKFPKLNAWISRLQTLPTIKETMFDTKTHLDFYKTVKSGKANYDIGLD